MQIQTKIYSGTTLKGENNGLVEKIALTIAITVVIFSMVAIFSMNVTMLRFIVIGGVVSAIIIAIAFLLLVVFPTEKRLEEDKEKFMDEYEYGKKLNQ